MAIENLVSQINQTLAGNRVQSWKRYRELLIGGADDRASVNEMVGILGSLGLSAEQIGRDAEKLRRFHALKILQLRTDELERESGKARAEYAKVREAGQSEIAAIQARIDASAAEAQSAAGRASSAVDADRIMRAMRIEDPDLLNI
jgi:hypothetical protein